MKNRFQVQISAIYHFFKSTKATNKKAIETFMYHDWMKCDDLEKRDNTGVYFTMGAIEPNTKKSIILDSIIVVSESEFESLFYGAEKLTISPSAYIESLENWLIFVSDCYQHNFDRFLELQKTEHYGAFAEYEQIGFLSLASLVKSISKLKYTSFYIKDSMPFEIMARRTKYVFYEFENTEEEKYISHLEELLIYVCHFYQKNHDHFFQMYIDQKNKYYYRLATVQGTCYRSEVKNISELFDECFIVTFIEEKEHEILLKKLTENQTKRNKKENA
ncbi:hypothetical protein BACERE00183_04518 [Bacillus cereus]|nr:hypothetical protein BACERE00183_04518 [Bacillus cereus]